MHDGHTHTHAHTRTHTHTHTHTHSHTHTHTHHLVCTQSLFNAIRTPYPSTSCLAHSPCCTLAVLHARCLTRSLPCTLAASHARCLTHSPYCRYDLTDNGVTIVEDLGKKRQPMLDVEAVYLCTPNADVRWSPLDQSTNWTFVCVCVCVCVV
jgi:hypothetical protein